MPTRWHMMSEKQLSILIQGRNYARGNRQIIRIPRTFACISAGAPWLWRSVMQIDKVSQEPARLRMLTAPFQGTFFFHWKFKVYKVARSCWNFVSMGPLMSSFVLNKWDVLSYPYYSWRIHWYWTITYFTHLYLQHSYLVYIRIPDYMHRRAMLCLQLLMYTLSKWATARILWLQHMRCVSIYDKTSQDLTKSRIRAIGC